MCNQTGIILGVGNILHSDDGIGIKILKYLDSQYEFPEGVDLIDGGTVGAQLDTSIVNRDWVIIVDALDVEGDPGEVKVLSGDTFINRPSSTKMSPHQVGFLDLIQLMKMEGTEPKGIDLIGIIPANTNDGFEMTPEVDDAMEKAIDALIEMLKQKGVTPVKRDPPLKPDYWWL
ncbi:MAG: HyaD/HybD family hydrogenase maturation endopeptidase [Proteobacteria bacterium]|nr:HyaD/HybD family hydrogenase maturation endopeptidase [Pseudomonadota bacterium]